MEEIKKIKVALIEDEEVLLNVLRDKLIKGGYDVVIAVDGVEAMRVIGEEKPDIILLDLMMPKTDGFEVLEHLNQDSSLSSIPVIIISNSGQQAEINRAMSLGAKDYLVKAEFDPQEILDKIEKQLKRMHKESTTETQQEIEKGGKVTNSDNKLRVLLVEDDGFLRDLISQKMEREGFVVTEAIDGEEAIKKVKAEKPSIVLLDLILPGIDGFEVLTKIRAIPDLNDVPVIILSNLGQKDDIEKGIRLGATDYLVKAHNTPGEIIDKIKSVIAS